MASLFCKTKKATPATTKGAQRLQLRIAVGTKNPCKIESVTKAIQQSISSATGSLDDVELHIEGFSVDSGVPDQPFGDVSFAQNPDG